MGPKLPMVCSFGSRAQNLSVAFMADSIHPDRPHELEMECGVNPEQFRRDFVRCASDAGDQPAVNCHAIQRPFESLLSDGVEHDRAAAPGGLLPGSFDEISL